MKQLLESVFHSNKVPSLAAAIATADAVIAFDAVGLRKKGSAVPVSAHDVYHIGSNTKSLTAGLIGLLVDEGRLAWEMPLPELFVDQRQRMRPEFRRVTLHDLLTHRSGLQPDAPGAFGEATAEAQRAKFVDWVLAQKPAGPHGKYAYANANYILAGALAERLTGIAYEDVVRSQLLHPLGLRTVSFDVADSEERNDRPWPHKGGLLGFRPLPPTMDNLPLYGPAGRASMSMHDWALWASAVLRAAIGGDNPWKPSTAGMLLTPVDSRDGMAMGWIVQPSAKPGIGRELLHFGSNTLHFAGIVLVPDEGFAVMAATNAGGGRAERAVEALLQRLIEYVRSEVPPASHH